MDVNDLGTVDYREAVDVQHFFRDQRIEGKIEDTLIVAEHYPVVTLGRTSGEDSIIDAAYFEDLGIEIIPAGRGGKNTYHAPGQVLLYPVIDIGAKKRKDISYYIDFLETTVARSLGRIGVAAERTGRRGVWSGGRKIAFIGIAVRKWVTFHGASININNGIEAFGHMAPCGETDITVTSAKEILGYEPDMDEFKAILADQFEMDMKEYYRGAGEEKIKVG